MSNHKTDNGSNEFPAADELFAGMEAIVSNSTSSSSLDQAQHNAQDDVPTIVAPPLNQPVSSPANAPKIDDAASTEPVNMRTHRDFSNARRHSRLVKSFKILFPIIAGLIVFAFIGIGLFYRQLPDNVSVDSAVISDGQLVMESPNLDGFDDKNRPYSVQADKAIQSLSNTDVIKLEGIHARLPLDNTNFAKINATNGIYDNKAKTLRLTNSIELDSTNGFIVKLSEADIDIQSGKLVSNAPVFVDSPTGKISADSLEITDNGKRILFKDSVKLTINPSN